ncbi:glycosyltransferase [Pseudomonas brassicacearum]|uniref:glycosyltransferase n=1 Tax=Pseudomonas brassicacearum TaxID=930166 RepID=UPI00025FE4D3|nr:glycosyltransferase [Pseudomonas brassicacearum]EIK66765.1 glycosyltransferase, group 1 family domain/glycosyl transferase, group 2 family domain protein [Pseudomonas fluorescens Q8r1-96]KAB0523468.1 glycosyltransferase [Pseudomonas brassicacearum subsp. brassicacearum]NJP61419.1 glycosyltransferase [Pseudomonas brassicacearum]QEO79659.1 glycosyltransferase [Pseudomonas brassicacearum]WLG66222.1 glycosyltransferase [Pseudomonas brassicacearum]
MLKLDSTLIDRDAALAQRDAAINERDIALAKVDFLQNTRSWRFTRPLRSLFRLMRYGFSATQEFPETAAAIVYPAAPQPLPNPDVAPDFTTKGRLDILCFANIEWAARFQRPQQLMNQFASNGYRVFYIVPSSVPEQGQLYRLTSVAPNIFEVALQRDVQEAYYEKVVTPENHQALLLAMAALVADMQIRTALSVVHIAYWSPVALSLRTMHGWRILYDCMDDWDGFPNIGEQLLSEEKTLIVQADLVTVSAALLYHKWCAHNPRCVLVRNAVDFAFFRQHCFTNDVLSGLAGPVIGYYGALAQWLDYPLLAALADRRPEWNFILVGDIFVDDLAGLEHKPNVQLLGRKPYSQMPLYLDHFDACLIPFRLYNVTHAVDPVKFYEYISAGKPVISTPLAEMSIYKDLLYFATGVDEFIEQIEGALAERDLALYKRRVELARANDWKDRFDSMQLAIVGLYEKVSIVLVTYNNLNLTIQCVNSILRNTTWPNYQLIVVDNGSEDGTGDYLERLRQEVPTAKVILNPDNRGFAAANNQGLREADGDILLLLNNDTVVPDGWLDPLVRHLRDPSIGLVGPVTNAVGNEAKIEVSYTDIQQMQDFSDCYTKAHKGQSFDISMLAMFCVAFRRGILEEVGYLDEAFSIGMFEDDDYSRRVQAAGYRTVCAEDAFIHHYGQASFRKLIASGEYQALWDKNQAYFESKWGAWQAHVHRDEPGVETGDKG